MLGGLLNSEMAEEVFRKAREVGKICSITYPLPKEEFQSHGQYGFGFQLIEVLSMKGFLYFEN